MKKKGFAFLQKGLSHWGFARGGRPPRSAEAGILGITVAHASRRRRALGARNLGVLTLIHKVLMSSHAQIETMLAYVLI